MKYVMPAIRFKLFMIVLLGFLYPFVMTGISQAIFQRQASGDFLTRGGQVVGSRLIAQKFEKSEYFWSRPSAVDYNPLPSGGSNLGLASADLKKIVDERKTKLKAAHPEQTVEPPHDLLFASGSGLDPHISPAAAQYQLQRVAKARNITNEKVQSLIEQASEGRQFGILGEARVNVLVLNMALDTAQGIESAPLKTK
ncbi:MAG: potassium-transporting ATPase subunit KdpC [Deltaproteobacteria bacterium]|nr:potassium-transporting ATPase subunit KdpC [Deltaproteobacteria bacterium]